jgi:hypothetical protein
MARKTWRLVDALLLFLLFLLPLMLIVGRGEGTIERATLLFWLMLILPLLILPWLWRGADPEERGGAPMLAAQRVAHESTAAEEFGSLVAPVVNVRRAYVEAGIPIVEGQLREDPPRAFTSLERLLTPRRMTPLMEDRPMPKRRTYR